MMKRWRLRARTTSFLATGHYEPSLRLPSNIVHEELAALLRSMVPNLALSQHEQIRDMILSKYVRNGPLKCTEAP
jgi:hypothetical protein